MLQSPVASGTTLLWLAKHLAFAERFWVVRRFAGRPQPVMEPVTPGSAYRRAWMEVDAVIAAAPSLDELLTIPDAGGRAPLRWIVAPCWRRPPATPTSSVRLIDGTTGRADAPGFWDGAETVAGRLRDHVVELARRALRRRTARS